MQVCCMEIAAGAFGIGRQCDRLCMLAMAERELIVRVSVCRNCRAGLQRLRDAREGRGQMQQHAHQHVSSETEPGSAAADADELQPADAHMADSAPDVAPEVAHTAREQMLLTAGGQQTRGACAAALKRPKGHASPTVAVAFGSEPPQSPAAETDFSSDQVGVRVSSPAAPSASHEATAATAHPVAAALQKQARHELSAAAGCSRAVPQHAVALMASLWAAPAAGLGLGLGSSGTASMLPGIQPASADPVP